MSVFDELLSNDNNNNNKMIVISVAIVIIAAVLVTSIYFINRSQYEVLFSDVSAEDMKAITTELDTLGIRHETDELSILVDASKVDEIRMKIANSSLLLSKNLGFEIFDNSEFGITEFAQQINYQRAMQGELSRTIMAINGIKQARVHLVMPEDGLFQQDKKKPSASVTLFVEDGFKLSETQIIGIQRLVSSSIEGMDMDRVTIVNNFGLTLNNEEVEDETMAVSAQLAKKIEMETYLENKAIKLLNMAIGDNCCIASVDVEMDFRTVTRTREEVLPQDSSRAGILKERILKAGGKDKTKQKPVTTDVEYKLGRQVAQITEVPGRLMHIGAGIVVPDYISDDNLEKIRALIVSSLGLDLKRGDTIAVANVVAAKPAPIKTVMSTESLLDVEKSQIMDEPKTLSETNTSNMTKSSMPMMASPSIKTIKDPGISAEIMSLLQLSAAQIATIMALVFACVLVALFIFYAFVKRRNNSKNRLSRIEREKMLKQVTSWLNTDADTTQLQAVNK